MKPLVSWRNVTQKNCELVFYQYRYNEIGGEKNEKIFTEGLIDIPNESI